MRISLNSSHRWKAISFQLSFLLAWSILLAGCLPAAPEQIPSVEPSPPGDDPTPEPAASSPLPVPSPTAPGEGRSFAVVGLENGEQLPLYTAPSFAAEISAQVPPTATNIELAPGGGDPEDGGWILVDYQGRSGWAERAHLAEQKGSLPAELVALGQTVTAALREGDYSLLSELIHPELCLRFSPYPFLRETDQVLCPEELAEIQGDAETKLFWGLADGSGLPLELTFQEYHQRFVYDQDYFQPAVVGFDQEVSYGNAINNIPEIYPDGIMVEYHFPGFDPQYGGMDWRSLRLVFVNRGGQWYLAALVHGEWTI